MNYKTFCKLYRPTQEQLFREFFYFLKDDISIKNEKIAVKKLSKIINATFKLITKQSFGDMSLRQLSDESGISMGGLYAYIKSKKQLAIIIHQFLNHFVMKTINKIEEDTKESSLETIVNSHIYLSEILQPWFFFAYMESKNLGSTERKLAKNSEILMETKLIEVISQGQKKEVYSSILTAKAVATLIKPLLHEWYLKRWKYKQRKISIDSYCLWVKIFIERGLTSPHSLTEHDENE